MCAQDYFKNFGYVMDVYLPRDKVNRSEHRGFGFVTFETEGAVMRISQHGQHQIRQALLPTIWCCPKYICPFVSKPSRVSLQWKQHACAGVFMK